MQNYLFYLIRLLLILNFLSLQLYGVLCSSDFNSLFKLLNREKIYGEYPVDLNDAYLETPDLIIKNGFPAETHQVTSGDGYILVLHRIPNPGRPVVLIAHGILDTSREFLLPVTGSSKDSLGMLLYQSGFDVWLFNARGNYYSQGHVNKSIEKTVDYWDFSADEQAFYDTPATIKYILSETKFEKINYIGFSLGNILLLKSLSIRPEFNDKINVFIGYASSSGYIGNTTNPLRLVTKLVENPNGPLTSLVNSYFKGQVTPFWVTPLLRQFYTLFCSYYRILCDFVVFLLVGYSPNKIIDDTFSVWMGRFPSSTSLRTLIGLGQEMDYLKESKEASRFYDFGEKGNRDFYGDQKSPVYNISNVSCKIFLFSGITDALISSKDSEWTASKTQNFMKHTILSYEDTWSHGDFFLSKYAPNILYKPTIGILKDYN